MNLADEYAARLQLAIERLSEEFAGTFSQETVDRYVRESITALSGARVKDYIPIFVDRFTRERLRALARAEGLTMSDRPAVLFVCVHNAGRSQIAAALTQSLSGGQLDVWSAGSEPADQVNPAAVQVMSEIGLDLSQEFPKPMTDEVVRAADVVITMGCGDSCPIYPGKKYEDWDVEDPAGQPPEKVRQIRDEIRTRVERLLSELNVPISRAG
jgi:protein-tyrosine-phosphatase